MFKIFSMDRLNKYLKVQHLEISSAVRHTHTHTHTHPHTPVYIYVVRWQRVKSFA
jgi:hypothetical protein